MLTVRVSCMLYFGALVLSGRWPSLDPLETTFLEALSFHRALLPANDEVDPILKHEPT